MFQTTKNIIKLILLFCCRDVHGNLNELHFSIPAKIISIKLFYYFSLTNFKTCNILNYKITYKENKFTLLLIPD